MTAQCGPWKKISQKNGITVYKRTVPGSEFREFKGTITVEASLSAFTALLLDAPRMSSWMHKTDEVRVIEQLADNERIAYMLFDFAPLGKRELVVRNRITQNPDDLSVHYSMEYLSDHEQLRQTRYNRIQGIAGFVSAVPQSERTIEITYQCHVEPGIKLLEVWGASAVTNKLLADTPYHTLRQAKTQISLPHYRNAEFEFVCEANGHQARLRNPGA